VPQILGLVSEVERYRAFPSSVTDLSKLADIYDPGG
jgi:hypothetical protein